MRQLLLDLHLTSVHQSSHLSPEPQLEQFIGAFSSPAGKQSHQGMLYSAVKSNPSIEATAAFPSVLQGKHKIIH